MSNSSSKELKILKTLKKELQAKAKNENTRKSHIVWPYTTRNQEPRTNAKIEEIVQKIEHNVPLTAEEKRGVVRRSPLSEIPNFDIVMDVPVDYLHAVCIGVVKRLIELTFNVGEVRPRQTSRKLSSAADYNKLMHETKFPRELSRRARDLLFAVMKATEYRNLLILFSQTSWHALKSMQKKEKCGYS